MRSSLYEDPSADTSTADDMIMTVFVVSVFSLSCRWCFVFVVGLTMRVGSLV